MVLDDDDDSDSGEKNKGEGNEAVEEDPFDLLLVRTLKRIHDTDHPLIRNTGSCS